MRLFGINFGLSGKHAAWPTAIATIDEIAPDEDGNMVISGAFKVNGDFYTVWHTRSFPFGVGTEKWVKYVEQHPQVTVHYNPDDPNENVVEDE